MMGFSVASNHLYGLPERSGKLVLKTTQNTEPYRLYSVDFFPHQEWS